MNINHNSASAAEPIKNLGHLMRWKDYIKNNYSHKRYVFFLLCLDTGISPGIILNLKNKEIDGQTLLVDPATRQTVKLHLINIPSSGEFDDQISIRISDEDFKEVKKLRALEPDAIYLFESEARQVNNPKPWSRDYITRFLKESAEHAGLDEKIGFLTLQKTWGSHLVVHANYSLWEIQRILRKHSLAATRQYLGITTEEICLR